jgi:radical SAM superfamily enzyme YgiQ (UPF0313 family)
MLPHGKEFNQDLIDHIHSINPNCQTVLGGPNAVDKKHNRQFDYVVVGYADVSVVNLAKHLLDGTPLEKSYHSLWGPTIINDAKASEFDFTNSTMQYEDHDAILPGETMQIEVSRGCIFQCAYCSFPLNGKHKLDFIRSEQRLREEFMHNYERWGVTRYMFLDDTFNDSVDKCRLIQRVSASLPFDLEYWAYIRLDLISAHPETAELLIDSGLKAMTFGIETWNKKEKANIDGIYLSPNVIVLKRQKSYRRETFTLIHELGHSVDFNSGLISNKADWPKAHAELKNWYVKSANKFIHFKFFVKR